MKYCLLSLFCYFFFSIGKSEVHTYKLEGQAQGTTYHITYFASTSVASKQEVDSILKVIDLSMSLYEPKSTISQFNQRSKGSVSIDQHFKKVMQKSFQIYQETDALFDVTILPLMRQWHFFGTSQDGVDTTKIAGLLKHVGMQKIKLKKNSLTKTENLVEIDLNGIAQGYSVDVLADFLERKGVLSYTVELGGEIRAKGPKPDGNPIKIGIEGVPKNEFEDGAIQHVISFNDGAVTTSGSYRKFVKLGSKNYGHIINPKTGFALHSDVISVTVFAKKAIDADGYDNALMLMGVAKSIAFVDRRKDLATYIIYRDGNGIVRDTASKAMKNLMVK